MKKNFSQKMRGLKVQAVLGNFLLLAGLLFISNFSFAQNGSITGVTPTPLILQQIQNQNIEFVDGSTAISKVEAELNRISATNPTTRDEKMDISVLEQYYPNLIEVLLKDGGSVLDALIASHEYMEEAITRNGAPYTAETKLIEVGQLLRL